VLLVILLGVGLNTALNTLDTYIADLTVGHGDFPATSVGATSTSYHADGLHLSIDAPGWGAPVGAQAPSGHSALTIAIAVTELQVLAGTTPGPGIGPWCFDGESYGFVLHSSGLRELVTQSSGTSAGDVHVIAQVAGAPWPAGQRAVLTLQCSSFGGKVTLRGYVNGTLALERSLASSTPEFHAGGFAGVGPTSSDTPAKWVISKYWRLGPDAMPK
jgi:hypothetical protein